MASTFKRVAWASLGNVLTTELNGLASAAYSTLGTAYDNTSGLYLYGALLINLASLTPGTGGYLQLFMTPALDGTNYDDVPSATNLSPHSALQPPLTIISGTATTKRVQLGGLAYGLPGFPLPAALIKFALLNGAGIGLGGSGSTVALYGAYEQAV